MDGQARRRGNLAANSGGGALGVLLVAGLLVLWRLSVDAAGFFAPAFAALGLTGLFLGRRTAARYRPVAAWALRVAGSLALVLALAASLSLGAFLPPRVAEWASPALGRFGGALALGLLAAAALLCALRAPQSRRRSLDWAVFLGAGAAWIWTQTARQIAFPPAPTVAETVAGRLQLLLVLGVALGLLALVLAVYQRRGDERLAWLGGWCRSWAVVAALLGLGVGVALGSSIAPLFVLPLGLALGAASLAWRWHGARVLLFATARSLGWLLLIGLALAVCYGATSEDLEAVLLRNTVERRVLDRWRVVPIGVAAPRATGSLSGTVRDVAGRPLEGANVVVAEASGRAFSATSDPDGRYTIPDIPAGNYLPLAIGMAYQPGGRVGLAGRVATVRPERATAGVDFALGPRPTYDPATNATLQLGPQTTLTIEGLVQSSVSRRPFTYANRGKTLDGGLIYEPPAEAGPGPFPILLIIYPGEAASWEGVSAPLAARGFVVISYFPRRLLDLEGDLDDLRLLLNLAAGNRLSTRGDGRQIALAGGSVSTVYTYLLAERLAGSSRAPAVGSMIQYGGLFDLYAFRQSWEAGDVVIDPGISELEYLLVAFGRPDTRPEMYLRLSPRYQLATGSLPPTLLVHAERDIIVPAGQSRLAAAGFERAAIPYRLLLYPNLEHYLDISKRDPDQLDMLEQTIAFLRGWNGAP